MRRWGGWWLLSRGKRSSDQWRDGKGDKAENGKTGRMEEGKDG